MEIPPKRLRRRIANRENRGAIIAGLAPTTVGLAAAASFIAAAEVSVGTGLGISALLLLTIALNGVFVAGNTAIDLLRPSHARAISDDSTEDRKTLLDLIDRKPTFVAACFLGSLTMRAWMVALTVVPSQGVVGWLASEGSDLNRWIAEGESARAPLVLVLTLLVLLLPVAAVNVVFGELVPKSYAVAHPISTSLRLYRVVCVFNNLFSIPIRAAVVLGGLFTKRFGAIATFAVANPTEHEIKDLLEEAEESGEIEEEEREMVASVFEFGDTTVREVMTPRVDLKTAPVEANLTDIAKLVEETGHSRIPVYDGTDDVILGVIHAKDVLSAIVHGRSETPVRELMRPPVFVPESKSLHDLLQEMRQGKTQMVIVQDEHSGTAGIVTIEDIVEEVMGEIVDEYDEDLPQIVAHEGGFSSDGMVELDNVNEAVGSEFESEEFDTIGGYVFGLFGRLPKVGDTVASGGYEFTVTESDKKRILRLSIRTVSDRSSAER